MADDDVAARSPAGARLTSQDLPAQDLPARTKTPRGTALSLPCLALRVVHNRCAELCLVNARAWARFRAASSQSCAYHIFQDGSLRTHNAQTRICGQSLPS
jgi:hypothetical protein